MAKRPKGRRSKRRCLRGGSYTSASTYGNYVNGSAGAQFGRTFDQSGPYGQVSGNVLIGAQGQNVISSTHMPNNSQLSLIQNGGRRKRGHRRSGHRRSGHRCSKTCRRYKKGGFIGQVIHQAVVPLSLVALNHTYGSRQQRGTKRRRHR